VAAPTRRDRPARNLTVRRLETPVTRFQASFLALIVTQAAHSVEEYIGRLHDVFPPARFVSGLVSHDLQRGFVTLNIALVTFGLCCFIWPVRGQWSWAIPLVWFWIVIEVVNGIGHPLWSVTQLGYTPGVATAPILLFLAPYLAWQLVTDRALSPQPPNNRWRGP
jgi:Protein of unknown function with HXXEE motif